MFCGRVVTQIGDLDVSPSVRVQNTGNPGRKTGSEVKDTVRYFSPNREKRPAYYSPNPANPIPARGWIRVALFSTFSDAEMVYFMVTRLDEGVYQLIPYLEDQETVLAETGSSMIIRI